MSLCRLRRNSKFGHHFIVLYKNYDKGEYHYSSRILYSNSSIQIEKNEISNFLKVKLNNGPKFFLYKKIKF